MAEEKQTAAKPEEKKVVKPEAKQSEDRVVIKKSLVNMSCHDGTHLVIGKKASISKQEYDRLTKHYKPEQLDAALLPKKKLEEEDEE